MHAHAVGRNVGDGVVECGDVDRDDLPEVGETFIPVLHVPEHGEVGTIELEQKTGVDDRLVFLLHHVGDGEDVLLLGLVVRVLEVTRDLSG